MNETKQYKKIHYHMFNPVRHNIFGNKKSDKATAYYIMCCNSENCNLYKKETCALRTMLGLCPYGKKYYEEGYTQRAKNFYTWIDNKNKKNKEIKCLSSPSIIMDKVGEYVYLPYPFVSGYKGIKLKHREFLELEHFNKIETLKEIINLIPKDLMMNKITRYQKEIVPKFVIHLSEKFPEIFKKVKKEIPRAKEIYDNHTNVGRSAMLFSINPDIGILKDIHGGEWTWDGKYLTSSKNKMSFGLVPKFTEVRLKIEEDQPIIISDDKQTNKNTVYLD